MFGYGFWGMGVLASGIPSLSNTQAAEVKAQQKALADAQKQSQQPNQQQTKCSAQAKANIVGIDKNIPHHKILNVVMHVFHVEHMFWTVRGSDGKNRDLTGGPPEGQKTGPLHEWNVDAGKAGKVFWTAPQTDDLCARVDGMEKAADSWHDVPYNYKGPNSNSSFNKIGEAGEMPRLAPFLTPGAKTEIPDQ